MSNLLAAVTESRSLACSAARSTTSVIRDLLSFLYGGPRDTFSPASLAAVAAVLIAGTTPAVLRAAATEWVVHTCMTEIRSATSGTADAWVGSLHDLESGQSREEPC